jgi:hypothetical protein
MTPATTIGAAAIARTRSRRRDQLMRVSFTVGSLTAFQG